MTSEPDLSRIGAPASRRDILRASVLATEALADILAVRGCTQGGPAYSLQLGEQSRALDLARGLLGDCVLAARSGMAAAPDNR